MNVKRGYQLVTGDKFRFFNFGVITVQSVTDAEDASMRIYGDTIVPDASRVHQVKVLSATPGVSYFVDRDREFEIV